MDHLLTLPRTKAISSNVKSYAYEEKTETLVIEFSRGGIYGYTPVDKDLYGDFLEADSMGSFVHSNLKNNPGIECSKLSN